MTLVRFTLRPRKHPVLLVLELFSRIKSSSLEIFQLEKLQNIEGMILERNGVDFRNEDDQIS